MNKLVECVPNFSEGQNTDVIKQITDSIESVAGIQLLNVDPGFEMNRTVVTFIGSPDQVKEAAFRGIKRAAELIDMSKHHGSHPRMGATDVCPFVPVNGVSEAEANELAHSVAKRVGDELGIPVFLYEKSAQMPERKNLAHIRQGEYEGFAEKMKKPEWKPDYGPEVFNTRSGGTVIGVREFLIAYNINLNTREEKYATDIAFALREKGRSARTPDMGPFYFKRPDILKYTEGSYPSGLDAFIGKTIDETAAHCKENFGFDLKELLQLNGINPNAPEGESVKIPGLFSHCKAIGWMVPEYGRAQISINLTDYHVTPMHAVFEAARTLAAQRGIMVTGSEIVGMVPFQALYETGAHYLRKQGRSAGIPYMDVLESAVQSLGLRDVSSFKIEERVLGIPAIQKDALAFKRVFEFTEEVSRESPAPGGGSVAALAGAIGAALASMVSNLTVSKPGSEAIDPILMPIAEECQDIQNRLLYAIDADAAAFNGYMLALRMPKKTDEEKALRSAAMQTGLKEAVQVPLQTARLSMRVLELAPKVIELGNKNSVTDIGVGAQMAYSGVLGGVYNVLINLKNIKDAAYVEEMKSVTTELEQAARVHAETVRALIFEKITPKGK